MLITRFWERQGFIRENHSKTFYVLQYLLFTKKELNLAKLRKEINKHIELFQKKSVRLIKNIHGCPGGSEKICGYPGGVDDSKKGYPQQGGYGFFLENHLKHLQFFNKMYFSLFQENLLVAVESVES